MISSVFCMDPPCEILFKFERGNQCRRVVFSASSQRLCASAVNCRLNSPVHMTMLRLIHHIEFINRVHHSAAPHHRRQQHQSHSVLQGLASQIRAVQHPELGPLGVHRV